MKHIIALHREVSMSTSASMFGPAVAMAAEAIERAPDIMIARRRGVVYARVVAVCGECVVTCVCLGPDGVCHGLMCLVCMTERRWSYSMSTLVCC